MRSAAEDATALRLENVVSFFPRPVVAIVPSAVVAVLVLLVPLEALRMLVESLANEHQVLVLLRDIVGKFFRTVKEGGFRDPDALAAPLLPGGECSRVEHPRVQLEHGIDQLDP